MSIKIPSRILYAKCKDVMVYRASTSGKVKVETEHWHEIEFSKGTAQLEVSSRRVVAGYEYNTQLRCKIRNWDQEKAPSILRIEFCEGPALILGSLDLPIHFERDLGLISKNLQINHVSWHSPSEYTA